MRIKKVVVLTTTEDSVWAKRFEKHSIMLARSGRMDYWGSLCIDTLSPATDMDQLDMDIRRAYIVSLLTPDFLAEVMLNERLLTLLTRLRVLEESVLCPLPVVPCRWRQDDNPFKGLTSMLNRGSTQREWLTEGNVDANLSSVVDALRARLESR